MGEQPNPGNRLQLQDAQNKIEVANSRFMDIAPPISSGTIGLTPSFIILAISDADIPYLLPAYTVTVTKSFFLFLNSSAESL